MKNASLIIAVLIVLGGASVYAFMNKQTTIKDVKTMQEPVSMVKEDTMMEKSKKYMPFSPELLENTTTTRRVLFFYANWCPTCKSADKSFSESESKIPIDVSLFRVNYNDAETDQAEKDLAKKYGVTYQHTFVQIDQQGNDVAKWNGGQIDEILSRLK